MNILIVAPATQERLRLFHLLSSSGHNPVTYDNGQQALDFFDHLNKRTILPYLIKLVIVKFILSDDMNGFRFIELARSKGVSSQFLVVYGSFEEDRELALATQMATSTT